MPKETPHQRRVELGNWLQTLLNPKINKWEIYQIINDALKLLDIRLPIDKRDYFFQLIENVQLIVPQSLDQEIRRRYEEVVTLIFRLYQLGFTQQEEYSKDSPDFEEIDKSEIVAIQSQQKINWEELPQVIFHENIPTGEDYDFIDNLQTSMSFDQEMIRKELLQKFRSKYNLPKFPLFVESAPLSEEQKKRYQEEVLNDPRFTSFDKRIIPYAQLHNPIENVLGFFDQREIILILLKKIKEQDRPWKLTIPLYCQRNNIVNHLLGNKYNSIRSRFDPLKLVSAYNKLNELLHIKDDSLTLGRTLLNGTIHSTVNDENNNTTYSRLPTDVLISKIIFDFLFLDGQDYYGFCEYCDSFFVVERKNRKKFCSDVCRTLNQRK